MLSEAEKLRTLALDEQDRREREARDSPEGQAARREVTRRLEEAQAASLRLFRRIVAVGFVGAAIALAALVWLVLSRG